MPLYCFEQPFNAKTQAPKKMGFRCIRDSHWNGLLDHAYILLANVLANPVKTALGNLAMLKL